MRGLAGRLATNLIWIAIFSVIVISYALFRYATGLAFDDPYYVTVEMPEAGGVLPSQEVTVLGRSVGLVHDVRLSENGVEIELQIRETEQVPATATVQVLRRSPIGEQAVDFQPNQAPWIPAEPDARITVTESVVPAQVPFLLEQTVELFSAIDTDDLSTVIHELAVALDGRGPQLVTIGRDLLDVNRTLVAGIPELERLTTSSIEVLDTLAASAHDLAQTFDNAADLAELLAREQPTLEALLDTAPVALSEAMILVEDQSANLGCIMGDLIAINQQMLGESTWDGTSDPGRYDSKLHEFERALQLHRSFFQSGFAVIGQPEYATGVYWSRIDLLVNQEGGGERYPVKRPTPATRPGAACVSEQFGLGVNAVRQADAQAPDSTSPGIEYAPIVIGERQRGTGVVAPTLDTGGLAATGGGALLLAPMLIGLALILRRRR
jgi:virulence factor Mce-like protein